MGHTERHIDKTDEILIHRLLKDWKVYSGTFFNDMTNEFFEPPTSKEVGFLLHMPDAFLLERAYSGSLVN